MFPFSYKGLEQVGYLSRNKEYKTHLTSTGQKIAEATNKRHRTVQSLLENLDVDRKTAAADACLIEHAAGLESYETLKALAKNPKNKGGQNHDD